MGELCSFYSSLYQKDTCSETLMDSLLGIVERLQKQKCEEKLTISECYNSLKSFEKNKTPLSACYAGYFY